MSYITNNDKEPFEEVLEEPRIRRRPIRESLTVCPRCFSPTKLTPGFFSSSYSCENLDCGWVGSLVIEVDRTEYQEFLEKQARQSTK